MSKIIPKINSKFPLKCTHHSQSRKWLEDFFPLNSCAYCWVNYEETDIDHYIPKTLDKTLNLKPFNHVLSCINCNRIFKRDYHPQHTNRKFYKNEKSGAHVHDPRRTDFSLFYRVKPDGVVESIHSNLRNKRWADWNITFFALNKRPDLVKKREAIMKALKTNEVIREKWSEIKTCSESVRWQALSHYIKNHRLIRKNKLFLKMFEIPAFPSRKHEK